MPLMCVTFFLRPFPLWLFRGTLLKPRSILLRAAENAAVAEKQRLKSERKLLRAELKEKDKKEKLLLEIEKKNQSLQRLASEQAKFEYDQKANARKKEAMNLLHCLINRIKVRRVRKVSKVFSRFANDF